MEITIIQAGLTEGELTLNQAEELKSAEKIILHTERCGAGEWLKKNNIAFIKKFIMMQSIRQNAENRFPYVFLYRWCRLRNSVLPQ